MLLWRCQKWYWVMFPDYSLVTTHQSHLSFLLLMKWCVRIFPSMWRWVAISSPSTHLTCSCCFQAVSQLSGQVDLLSPLQVRVRFPPIPRRPPTFNGGDPVDLIDYRTIPILIVEGNTTASVRIISLRSNFLQSTFATRSPVVSSSACILVYIVSCFRR